MHFKISSAIRFTLNQSKILLSVNGLSNSGSKKWGKKMNVKTDFDIIYDM